MEAPSQSSQSPQPSIPARLDLGLVVDLARVAEQPLAREHQIRRGQLQILANKLNLAGYCQTHIANVFMDAIVAGYVPWQLDPEDLALLKLLYSLW